MKKLLAVMLCLVFLLGISGCNEQTDLEKITKKGKIVVGVTDYMPINYKVDGEWTGFDTEFARLFAEKLGVKAEFKEIVWAQRYDELIDGNIDCIWNAMTVMPLYQNHITVSHPYILNGQVLVMKADRVKDYKNGYDVRNLKFVSEETSAGQACIYNDGLKSTYTVKTQQQALKDVASGKADATVIDSILADALVGKGKQFDTLAKSFSYSNEYSAVGFRKESDLTQIFNDFLSEIKEDELIEIANKYGLTLY